MMVRLRCTLLVLCEILTLCGCCEWYTDVWQPWGPCTESCGGGTRTRHGDSCFWGIDTEETGPCNEFCYNGGRYESKGCSCSSWRSGRCCEACIHINIPNCKPDQQQCGGPPDNIKCTDCYDPYYPAGFGNGCALCPSIDNCQHRHCTSLSDTTCTQCYDDNFFYMRTSGDTKCERMCAWNNHYCWPGKCTNKLTTGCTCSSGFTRVRQSSETSCQLSSSNAPSIEKCETRVVGPNGEMERAQSISSSTACSELADFYGNFQPKQVIYDLLTEFTVNIGSYPKPSFIHESNFGVTDVLVRVEVQHLSGTPSLVFSQAIFTGKSDSTDVTQLVSDARDLTLGASAPTLMNGQWLCTNYEANGGGYLRSVDLTRDNQVPSSAVPYRKTKTTRRLCYRYDDSPPEHCKLDNSCYYEHLQISEVITRSAMTTVSFKGWRDPLPAGSNDMQHASGIESYHITVNEVSVSNDVLKVDTGIVHTEKVGSSTTSVQLNLTSEQPKLYAIYLEVKDVASNVKQGRRFVLFDNSSTIDVSSEKPFYVDSASPQTKYSWQTHHNDICLNWTDHFYNQFYFYNPLLNPIEADPSRLINGVYEQRTGQLPITGTPNVHGIVNFKYSWALNDGSVSAEITVPHFQQQYYCHSLDLKDGETYTLNIRAIDIAGNNYTDNRTVHIDRTVPDINNIWLVKNGVHRLFVHDQTDLSKMKLYFEALDPHSGIREIQWAFGTSDSGSKLLTENIAVYSIDEACPTNSSEDHKCYCPDVGQCEFYQYTLPMNKLVAENNHIGDHNRNYFFTINVTNQALLSTIEHVDILVDDSPPEKGVVFEGPESSPDIDYTSDDSFIVHWFGFIDHESGIKLYQLALSDRCLNKEEMSNTTFVENLLYHVDMPYTEYSTRLPANFTGKMITTIVALNNAMAMSDPVCSDGITRAIDAPRVTNITVQHGKWQETLICLNGQMWLLNSEMKKLKLNDTVSCLKKCNNLINIEYYPTTVPTTDMNTLDDEVSELLCNTLPNYTQDKTIIYLPNDNINITWDVEEAGSQIKDYFVGIGLDSSESFNPDQMQFKSTGQKTLFNMHHAGIGSSELFYVFLKAENKAGLTRVSTIGPLLIDETPPLYKALPGVKIEDYFILVTWENDTFYDNEQTEPIDSVFFQFSHDERTVTPLMEWKHSIATDCLGHTGMCIKYPIKTLQQYDTELGLDFYVSLFVYNKAGHFLKLDTETFRLPSIFPPGSAEVLDIDPEDDFKNSDVNAHFTESTLCAQWNGFRHHENITLEFAVGSNTKIDDVIPFQKLINTNSNCINSSNLIPGNKYHVLVRSTCSGGSTTSASNGVTILTQAFIDTSLQVLVGKYCYTSLLVKGISVVNHEQRTFINVSGTLEIGKSYQIFVPDFISMSIRPEHGSIKKFDNLYLKSYYTLVSFVHHPLLEINEKNKTIDASLIRVVECFNNPFINVDNTYVDSHWYFTTGRLFPVTFEAGVVDQELQLNLLDEVSVSSDQDSSILLSKIPMPHNINSELSYKIAVRPCTERRCLKPVLSANFSFVFEPPIGGIKVAEINVKDGKDCFDLDLQWEAFISRSPMLFYQWALSEDATSYTSVSEWSTKEDATAPLYQIRQCLRLPHDLYKTMFACVRGYTEAEQRTTVCKELHASRGTYKTNVVYDIDTTSKVWPDIKEVITSTNLGDKYRLLHDAELDFGTTSAMVAGVVMYGTERIIAWYLMTQREIPSSCKYSAGCSHSDTSTTGYIEFDRSIIQPNKVYYICAMSNATHVERELFTESLVELNVCSDGFVLDDAPPSAGKIQVTHTNGYLTDTLRTRVSVDGFYDNVDATQLGFINSIKSYSFAVGSRTEGDDIVSYTDVGLSKVAVFNLAKVSDGATVYFTAKATDQSGLSTNMSSEGITVDTSSPTTGMVILNDGFDTKYITTDTLRVRPSGFRDHQSGIQRYEISVGSAYNTEDIIKAIDVTGEIDLDIPKDTLFDGHAYYITVKAFNRAGLQSNPVRKRFTYDGSPPTGGRVLDGDRRDMRDIDFHTDVIHITSHWVGFDDMQSGIQSYRVGLGLEPLDDDVEPIIDVGLNTGITWNASFVPGQMYYTTVEACNHAGLCTRKASNGITLDNSPPIHGLVRVGSGSHHNTYIPMSSSVHLHWHGFEDPESGIERFDACIGTKARMCNVEPMFNCLLQSNILKTGLTLPANTHLYATVYAYNKAGLRVEQSSDAFMVDESPPVIITNPTFALDYKSFKGFQVQWDPSILNISWKFEDDESPIIEHTVALRTHHEGHISVDNFLIGNEHMLTISFDGDTCLKSGDRYFVDVTSCNVAGHCSTAQSNDLLIDSSPPHLGGFRPPLTWISYPGQNTSEVSLTWYGFHDQESELAKYFISVSRSYSGNELSNGEQVVIHNSSNGIQESTITLREKIKPDDLLILSIWAQNHAGLNSSIARVSVNALSTSISSFAEEGILELEKHSCDVHYCNNDCTCAVISKPCTVEGISDKCTFLNTTEVLSNSYPVVEVYGGLETHPQQITASSACLSGHWRLSTFSDRVSRFEWSMGLVNQPIGEGIFNLKKEIPWKDVGLRKEVVHCLQNMSLLHDEEYVIYVRVWYSSYQSAIFTSNSIMVDWTSPVVRRGRSIKDSDPTCGIDLDFIDWMDTITACWANVFNEQQSYITHYVVSLGTSAMADDVLSRTYVGLNTSLTLTNLTLAHGTKYHFRVTAFNIVGLHTSLSSDGFIVDMDTPIAGVVYNTGRLVNAAYQSSNDHLSVSWHGFIDHYSGIRSYHVGMFEGEMFNEYRVTLHNVGLRNSFTFTNLSLDQGYKYIVAVKAIDSAGHESNVSISPTITIDTTPPEGFDCLAYQDIIYEEQICAHDEVYSISSRVNLNRTSFYKIDGFMTEFGTAELTMDSYHVSLSGQVAHNESSHFQYTFLPYESNESVLTISGICQANTSVAMRLSRCSEMKPGRETVFTVQQIAPTAILMQWMILDPESRVKKIKVGLGSTPGGFQIKDLSEVHRDSNGFAAVDVPHGTRVYATVTAENHAGLRSIFHAKPITIDKTPPVFTSTPTLSIEDLTNTTQDVMISWCVVDEESEIKQCFCGLGNQPSSNDLHSYVISDNRVTCRFENVSLPDVIMIYANVLCINGAELAVEMSSSSVLMSNEPPSAHDAVVNVVPESNQLSTLMLTYQLVPVQSNLTCIRMQWSDFSDVLGIDRFEYRLKHGEIPVTDWVDAGRQTMASIDGLHLQTGSIYTTEVRAVNAGHHISEVVHADVFVLETGPMLSGKTMMIKVVGESMNLDWSGVFDLHKDAAVGYTLTIGTKNGYNDVINNYFTTDKTHTFDIPSSTMISLNVNELFLTLSSVYSSGRSTIYKTVYRLA